MPNRLAGSLRGSCPTRPRAGLSPDIDRALGEIAVCPDLRLEKKRPLGQRVLDGLSGARVGGWLKTGLKVSDTVSIEMSTSDAEMVP